ncbi:PREDICTED: protein LSM12 homolog [Nicrophorus vespilloides]|uniref:Protein LSM12 homolog n=1 Tax=Nicrophorus vespilloides TaxID=110193 RepID=A0ABM1M2V7_NICVS|nr:PREDICTED: protein LSM12 homolog [Nicrophorus vespilloides]
MAAVTDCFTLGSTVWCRTCYNQEIEGDVLAFDEQTKILILKCPTASGINNLHDVQFINLALVSELQVKKEVTTPPEGPQSLNLQRLNTRIRNQVDEKKRLLTSLSSSVPPEGQRLFVAISKMFKEVQWRNADIVVWNSQVIITPPYQVENVKGNTDSKEFSFVKKLVEKHHKDTALSQTTSVNNQVVQHNANMQ